MSCNMHHNAHMFPWLHRSDALVTIQCAAAAWTFRIKQQQQIDWRCSYGCARQHLVRMRDVSGAYLQAQPHIHIILHLCLQLRWGGRRRRIGLYLRRCLCNRALLSSRRALQSCCAQTALGGENDLCAIYQVQGYMYMLLHRYDQCHHQSD